MNRSKSSAATLVAVEYIVHNVRVYYCCFSELTRVGLRAPTLLGRFALPFICCCCCADDDCALLLPDCISCCCFLLRAVTGKNSQTLPALLRIRSAGCSSALWSIVVSAPNSSLSCWCNSSDTTLSVNELVVIRRKIFRSAAACARIDCIHSSSYVMIACKLTSSSSSSCVQHY
jgi:hypothetical protein